MIFYVPIWNVRNKVKSIKLFKHVMGHNFNALHFLKVLKWLGAIAYSLVFDPQMSFYIVKLVISNDQ